MYITTFKEYVIHTPLLILGGIPIIHYFPLEWLPKMQGSGAFRFGRYVSLIHVADACDNDCTL